MDAGIIIPLAAFAMVFGIVFVSVMSSHKERMSMLEKGINPNEFAERKRKDPLRTASWLLSIGLGLGLGYILNQSGMIKDQGIAISFCLLVFMGIGQLLYFAYRKKHQVDFND